MLTRNDTKNILESIYHLESLINYITEYQITYLSFPEAIDLINAKMDEIKKIGWPSQLGPLPDPLRWLNEVIQMTEREREIYENEEDISVEEEISDDQVQEPFSSILTNNKGWNDD